MSEEDIRAVLALLDDPHAGSGAGHPAGPVPMDFIVPEPPSGAALFMPAGDPGPAGTEPLARPTPPPPEEVVGMLRDALRGRTAGSATDRLAEALRTLIDGRRLLPGTRLPAHRALVKELQDLDITESIAQGAYQRLVARGLLTARPGRGTFVAGSPGVAGPATGSRVSRVAGAVLPGAGHPQGREPAGDVAALEASSPAGRRPEPPPQVPGAVEGLQGETGGSGSVWGGATGSEVRSGPLPEGLAEGLAGDHPEGFSLTGPATGEVFSSGGVGRVREEPAAGAEPVPPDSMDVDDLFSMPEEDIGMSEEDIRAVLALLDDPHAGSGAGHPAGPVPMDFIVPEPPSGAALFMPAGDPGPAGTEPLARPTPPPPEEVVGMLRDALRGRTSGSATDRLAEALRTLIDGRRLPPGTRLPAHRALVKELQDLDITESIAQGAYQRLVDGGLLTVRSGVGTFVAGSPGVAMASPPPDPVVGMLRDALRGRTAGSATDRLAEVLRTLIDGQHLLPGTRLPGHPKLVKELQDLDITENIVRGAYQRLVARGLLTARRGVGTFVAGSPGVALASPLPEEVVGMLRDALRGRTSGSATDRLAEALRTLIDGQRLLPGTRLPGHRTLVKELQDPDITKHIAQTAYQRLVARGLLTARPGGGTFVAGPPGVAGPATGSRVSRVAGAVLPGAGHPQGREPAGDVAALEASSPAGRRPEPPP